MLKGLRVALVEDDEFMGGSLAQRLELEGAEVIWLRLVARALGALRTPRAPIDAVICDIRLPDGSGEDLFVRLCETATPPPFLFITGHGGIEQAVRLMRAGASDYVTKPFEMPVLLDRLAGLLAEGARDEFPPLLGVSPASRKIESQVETLAAQDGAVLILGGPGTGKGLVAERIHQLSDRRAAPFLTVNLAREADAATRLFGPDGALELVGEGTLYLHAINHLPETAQEGLITHLRQGFEGRVIASCGQQHSDILARGGPAAEILYQLDMHEIAIPPLSERPEDAVWLMSRLFPAMNARRDHPLDRIGGLTEEAARAHSWPGGGRELRARLARGVASAKGPMLQTSDLFPERIAEGNALLTLAEMRDAAERRYIIEVLERGKGRIGQAAKTLKVSRTTLWDKMKKYGIQADDD